MQAGERPHDRSNRHSSRAGDPFAAPCPVDAAALSRYAATPLRVFDPFNPHVVDEFADFLAAVPMANRRPLPARAVRETCSALEMSLSHTLNGQPTYFVATNLEKTAVAPLPPRRRAALKERYGEALYPQSVAPVFASHANADVPSMLQAATGLDRCYFAATPGSRDRLHALFLLTEASHCAFLARFRARACLPRPIGSVADLRAVIEAVGDFEAVAAFRQVTPAGVGYDEPDVLVAARILAMFLSDHVSAYTTIPALSIAFDESGIAAGIRRLPELMHEVVRLRQCVRSRLRTLSCGRVCRDALQHLELAEGTVGAMIADPSPDGICDSSIARALLPRFAGAVSVIRGVGGERGFCGGTRVRARKLLTLPGAVAA